MKVNFIRILSITIIFTLLTFQIGCTKEKAEALKTAANDFKTQADSALDKLDKLFVDDVAFTPETKEESIAGIIDALKTQETFGQEEIEAIVNGAKLEPLDTSGYSRKINELRNTYAEFSSMYENLPKGSFLAGDAVTRSENLAIKLTAQMTFLAKHIKAHPFKLNARLQAAIRKRNEALAESNPQLKQFKLTALAEEIMSISNDTKAANNAAILECLKGAEIGLNVAQLIKNYNRLSVNDILGILKQTLGMVNQLTGKNTDVLIKRVGEIETIIQNDPVWREVANQVTSEMNRT